jgi:hypothetical protein
MKKQLFVLFLIVPLLVLSASEKAEKKESIVRIDVPNHDAVYDLQSKFSDIAIITARDSFIDVYADAKMIEKLRGAGYRVTILVDDYQKEPPQPLQAIHTYAQVCSTMYALHINYPNITKLETLGFSYGNRVILAMKVTDNPLVEEAEPEIRLVGAHHGNEKMSTEITLAFLKYLLENYMSQPIATLVDNREIWIIPIFNPDGHVNNSRYNGASVDLNRDYGYMWTSNGPFSQPETRAMMKHAQNNNIIMEYEYHTTEAYVNYLWDYHPKDPPDSAYIIQISQEYADSTYGTSTTRLYKINGYDWYVARGSAQDACFGIWGGIGTTIETQYPTTQAKVDSICIANRRALLAMITRTGWGISGMVRDSLTQAPLFAMVRFFNPKRWPIYTDKQVGDFHKMVSAGTYTFRVEVNGYLPKTFTVTVPTNSIVNVDCDLVPDTLSLNYVQKLIWVRRDQPDQSFVTVTMDGLGKIDSIPYALGPSGQIVLEADPPIRNLGGNDFTVYESDATPEAYTVSLSNDWRSTFYSYGSFSGTHSFDLSTVSMDSARYIKIVNSGGGSSSDPYSGFDFDGISYGPMQSSIVEDRLSLTADRFSLGVWPNPTKSFVNIKYQISNIKNTNQILKIYNAKGGLVRELNLSPLNHNLVWDTKDNNNNFVVSGIYFCIMDNEQEILRQKVVINR